MYLTMRNEVLYLKDEFYRTKRKMEITKKFVDRTKRFSKNHPTNFNESIQSMIKAAKYDYLVARKNHENAKQDFESFILNITKLFRKFRRNYEIRISQKHNVVNILFGGKGKPYGKGHGHYVIDLYLWQYKYRRDVNKPHRKENHITINLEISC